MPRCHLSWHGLDELIRYWERQIHGTFGEISTNDGQTESGQQPETEAQ